MGPMVQQLEKAYAGRVNFRVYTLDKLAPGEYDEMKRIADLVDFHVTPTFVTVDRTGRVIGRYEGTTSYLTLKRDLDRIAAP